MSAQEDFQQLVKFGKDFLGLADEELENFVTSSMKRKGHKQVSSWADSENGDGTVSDFFAGPRQPREQRQVRKASGNGDWQYS